jgi:hypothetical protein
MLATVRLLALRRFTLNAGSRHPEFQHQIIGVARHSFAFSLKPRHDAVDRSACEVLFIDFNHDGNSIKSSNDASSSNDAAVTT